MRIFAVVLVVLMSATAAVGAVIHVPQDYSTIHLAVTAAATNDTILLASGHYTENIGIFLKGVVIKSELGRDSTFWSPSNAYADIVFIDNCAGFTNSFEGITFTGATIYACINSYSGNVNVLNCAFVDNATGSVFRGTLDLGFGNYIVRGNRFVDNHSADQGGGAQVESANWAIIEDNLFLLNSANHGGGLSIAFSHGAVVTRNLFYGNSAQAYGGAIYAGGAEGAIIYNNTIDSCKSNEGIGGGLSFFYSSQDTAFNNIITRCSGLGVYVNSSNGIVEDYNDVYGNTPNDFEGTASGVNSISLDPQFVGGNPFDFSLQSTSPCIDAGNPLARFNDPDGSRADMGAYPFVGLPAAFSLLSPVNSVDLPIDDNTPTFIWHASTSTDSIPTLSYSILISTDSLFSSPMETSGLSDTSYTPAVALNWGTQYWWKVKAVGSTGQYSWSNEVFTFRTMLRGDMDANLMIDISDVVYLINYLFAYGPVPKPMASANANCDARINIGDAVFLINYIFAGGPAPCTS